MEPIRTILESSEPEIVVFLLATIVALISWTAKSFVEKPLIEARKTFDLFAVPRMEILFQIKVRLKLLKCFPSGRDSEKLKLQIQDLILNDERCCFLSPKMVDEIISIVINKTNSDKLTTEVIAALDRDLGDIVRKIHEELKFHHSFSSPHPFRRIRSLVSLLLYYSISFAVISGAVMLVWHLFHE